MEQNILNKKIPEGLHIGRKLDQRYFQSQRNCILNNGAKHIKQKIPEGLHIGRKIQNHRLSQPQRGCTY